MYERVKERVNYYVVHGKSTAYFYSLVIFRGLMKIILVENVLNT
jgi:hypothetical protein